MGIKEKLPWINSDKRRDRIAGYLIYGLVIFFAIGAIGNHFSPVDEGVESGSMVEEEDDGVLDEQDVEALLGWGRTYTGLTVNGPFQEDKYVIIVTREMSDSSIPSWELDKAKRASIDIFKDLFKDPRIEKVTVSSMATMIDQYGQESQEEAAKFTMTRETYEKINWDNVLWSDLEQFSDGYYIHPAVR